MSKVPRGNCPTLQLSLPQVPPMGKFTTASRILGVQVDMERMAVWAKVCGGWEGGLHRYAMYPQVEAAAGNPKGEES